MRELKNYGKSGTITQPKKMSNYPWLRKQITPEVKARSKAAAEQILNPRKGLKSKVLDLNEYSPKTEPGSWVYDFFLGDVFSQVSFHAVRKLYLGDYSTKQITQGVRYYNYSVIVEYNNLLDREKALRKQLNLLEKNHPYRESLTLKYNQCQREIEEFDHPIVEWDIETNLNFLTKEILKFQSHHLKTGHFYTHDRHLYEYYKLWCDLSGVFSKAEYVGIELNISAAQFFADVRK